MANVKLYRNPESADKVGIPAEGEWFTPEDAARLVGQGLASRQAPPKTPARPAKEA